MSLLRAYIESVLAQRPASFWPGGEPGTTAHDAVQHPLENQTTYDGTLEGSVTGRYPSGLAVGGFAWDFNGGAINVPNHSEYQQNEVTLEAWVNVDNRSGYQGIISKTASNQPKPWDAYLVDGSGILSFLTTAGSLDAVDAVPLLKWTHLLCRCQVRAGERRLTIHYDGKLQSSAVVTGAWTTGTDRVRIGNRNDGVTSMDGRIAFPAIYPHAIALGPVRQRIAMARGLLGQSPVRALALR